MDKDKSFISNNATMEKSRIDSEMLVDHNDIMQSIENEEATVMLDLVSPCHS